MYKKIVSIGLSFFILAPSLSFYIQSVEAETSIISTPKDRASSITDTVNEITGDINLPVQLFSIPGQNGTGFDYSLSYNSNIQDTISTWNIEKPTGLMGLGWSGSQEVIWRDNNGTANNSDDSFYISVNGSFSKLIKNGSDFEGDIYQLLKYQAWKIRHISNSSEDTWTLYKEDGTKMIFGGSYYSSNGQYTTDNGGIQWGVSWDNWIGSSAQITNQSQFPVAWNISRVENMWGEGVDYTYYLDQHHVGQSGSDRKKYTQATRIKNISNNNFKAEFSYQKKESYEYQDPHTQAYNGQEEIRTISGNMSTTGIWDNVMVTSNYAPDPVVHVSVSGQGFSYSCPNFSAEDKESIFFDCELPSNAPSDITVTVSAEDDDSEFISWSSWDDTMWSSSHFDLSCNMPAISQTQTHSNNPVVMTFSYKCDSAVDEPDAYQERYDSHYLSSIQVSNHNNTHLYTVQLGYLNADGTASFLRSSDNNNQMSKRLLSSISFFTPDGKLYSPPYQFSYWGQSSEDRVSVSTTDDSNIFSNSNGALYGALKSAWLPTGGKIEYKYNQNNISTAERSINVTASNSDYNWAKPKVYWGSDYFINTWQSSSHILIQPYLWSGRWIAGETEEHHIDNPDEILVSSKGWFYSTFRLDSGVPKLSITWKNSMVTGSWNITKKTLVTSSTDIKNYQLETGDNFVALLDSNKKVVYRFRWNGNEWIQEQLNLDYSHNAISANNNLLFVAQKNGKILYPKLYRLEDDSWQGPTVPSSGSGVTFSEDVHIRNLEMSQSFAAIAIAEECTPLEGPSGNGTFYTPLYPVFHWDKNFSSLTQKNIDPQEAFPTYCHSDKDFPLSVVANNIYISKGQIDDDKGGSIIARYDGVDWIQLSANKAPIAGGLSEDIATITGYKDFLDDYISYFQFNPNTTTWEELTQLGYTQTDYQRLEFWVDLWFTIIQIEIEASAALLSAAFPPFAPVVELFAAGIDLVLALGQTIADYELNKQIGAHPTSSSVSQNFISVNHGTNGKLYHRGTDDTWTSLGNLSSSGINDKSELATLRSFDIYRDDSNKNYAQLFRNGQMITRLGYGNSGTLLTSMNDDGDPSNYQAMTGNDTFLAYLSSEDSFRDADNFYVFREENDNINGTMKDFVVKRATVYNGYSSDGISTDYQYDLNSAVMSSSGTTAYYQKVTIIPSGSSNSVDKSNGFSQHFFYNTSPVNSSIAPPAGTVNFCTLENSEYSCSDVTNENYSYAFGLPYLSRSCSNNNGDCNELGRVEHSYNIYQANFDNSNIHGYFSRPISTTSTQDGTINSVSMEYNNIGMLNKTTTNNYSINTPNNQISNNLTQETFTTEYAYIQDKYTADLYSLQLVNLLSPVVETTTTVTTLNESNLSSTSTHLSQTISTWKKWTNNAWGPYQEYTAVVETPSPFNWSIGSQQSSDWLKTAEVTKINSSSSGTKGISTEGKDRNNIYTSSIYDSQYRKPIAQFSNARVEEYQANYFGFEDYENSSFWSMSTPETLPYNQMPPTHTGNNALYSSTSYVGVQSKYFSERDNQTSYVLSAWVKPRDGYSCTASFSGSNNTVNSSTESKWQFLQIMMPSPVYSYNIPMVYCSNGGSIDDIWFGPIDSTFSAIVYEEPYFLPTAFIEENGETTKILYNNKQESIAVVSSNNQITSVGLDWTGRCTSNNNKISACLTELSSSNLNSSTSVLSRTGGYFDDFSLGETPQWTTNNNSQVEIVNGRLWMTGNSSITYPSSLKADGVSIYLTPGANEPSDTISVNIGNSGILYTADNSEYQLKVNGVNVSNSIIAPYAYHWVILSIAGTVYFYGDGKLLISYQGNYDINGGVSITTTGSTSKSTSISHIGFLNDIQLSQAFVDGINNSIQSQHQETSDTVLISQNLFDDLGRQEATTKMARKSGVISMDTNFATGFGNNQELSGDISTYYNGSYCFGANNAACEPNDSGYSYSRQAFETNPLGRTVAMALPGANFAMTSVNDQTNVSLESYGPTTDSNSILNQLGVSSNSYQHDFAVNTQESPWSTPDHIPSTTISNIQGKVLARQTGNSSTDASTLTTSVMNYNPSGNSLTLFHPNYFANNNSYNTSNVSTINYNAQQRVKSQSTPDSHTIQFIYDINGNLRFSMDANGAVQSPNLIKYYKYDTLGRPIEEGYINTMNWNESTLQNYANTNPNWPIIDTWKTKFYYDYNSDLNSTRNWIGRLYKTESNTDYSGNNIITQEYYYNSDGFTIANRISSNLLPDQAYTILYEYDQLGNVTKITYPVANITTTGENLSINSGNSDSSGYYQAENTVTVEDNTEINNGVKIVAGANGSINIGKNVIVNSGAEFIAYITQLSSGGINPAELNGPSITYTYNQLGQVEGVGTEAEPYLYGKYNYYAGGKIAQELLNNQQQVRTYTYASQGSITSISDNFFDQEICYTVNCQQGSSAVYQGGLITQNSFDYKFNGPKDYRYNYTYDSLGRLIDANATAINNSGFSSSEYDTELTYDSNGNISILERNSNNNIYTKYSSSSTNGPNQIKNTDGGSDIMYQYDPNGNTTSSTPKNLSGNNAITYDPVTQLSSEFSLDNGNTVSLNYDSNRRRVIKTNSGTESSTYYVHGLSNYPLLEKTVSNNSFSSRRYIYGPTGLIAINENNENNYFVSKDNLGSMQVLSNSDNNVESHFSYLPFGGEISSNSQDNNSKLTSYRYTSQEYDSDLDLYNYKARFYDTDLARFYAPDPAMQYFSPYAYVGNNPINGFDPSGMVGISTVVKVASIGLRLAAVGVRVGTDIYHIVENPGDPMSWLGLGMDLLAGGLTAFHGASEVIGEVRSAENAEKNINTLSCPLKNSFTGNTLVKTLEGQKPIKDINTKDKVMGYNEKKEELGYYPITEVLSHELKENESILVVHFGDTNIETTVEHPFWVEGIGWKLAEDLEIGDLLLSADLKLYPITSIGDKNSKEYVYNFEVAEAHNYFVTELGILVHNPCSPNGPSNNINLAPESLTALENPHLHFPNEDGKFRTYTGVVDDSTGTAYLAPTLYRDPVTKAITQEPNFNISGPEGYTVNGSTGTPIHHSKIGDITYKRKNSWFWSWIYGEHYDVTMEKFPAQKTSHYQISEMAGVQRIPGKRVQFPEGVGFAVTMRNLEDKEIELHFLSCTLQGVNFCEIGYMPNAFSLAPQPWREAISNVFTNLGYTIVN